MSAHDAHLAGYRTAAVEVSCRSCGHSWDGRVTEEYGTAWLEPHEDCPKCGSTEIDSEDLTSEDIAERRYESRGLL